MSRQIPLVILVGLLAVGGAYGEQAVPGDSNASLTPSDVARLQAERGAVVKLPANGKVKLSLEEDAPTFPMPGGMSSVVLLQLPDYERPYELKLISSQSGRRRTTEIFVPSGIYFDDEFHQIAEWGEERLERKEWTVFMSVRFLESGRAMRYLLLYTRGEWLGLHMRLDLPGTIPVEGVLVPVPGKIGNFLGNPFNFMRQKRSLRGRIQVETTLDKKPT